MTSIELRKECIAFEYLPSHYPAIKVNQVSMENTFVKVFVPMTGLCCAVLLVAESSSEVEYVLDVQNYVLCCLTCQSPCASWSHCQFHWPQKNRISSNSKYLLTSLRQEHFINPKIMSSEHKIAGLVYSTDFPKIVTVKARRVSTYARPLRNDATSISFMILYGGHFWIYGAMWSGPDSLRRDHCYMEVKLRYDRKEGKGSWGKKSPL